MTLLPSLGHHFDADLRCRCGMTWAQHQTERVRCPHEEEHAAMLERARETKARTKSQKYEAWKKRQEEAA